MFKLLAPDLTGDISPDTILVISPACGTAPPDLEIRASTLNPGNDDKFIPGAIAIASVNVNAYGHFCGTGIRNTASGMRGALVPAAPMARASTNRVSPGAIFASSSGATITFPLTAAPALADEFAAKPAAEDAPKAAPGTRQAPLHRLDHLFGDFKPACILDCGRKRLATAKRLGGSLRTYPEYARLLDLVSLRELHAVPKLPRDQ